VLACGRALLSSVGHNKHKARAATAAANYSGTSVDTKTDPYLSPLLAPPLPRSPLSPLVCTASRASIHQIAASPVAGLSP